MTTGEKLKKLRKDKKYTMNDLAKILNEKYNLNINKSMMSKWENGTVSISNVNANAYCRFFDVSLDYLIYDNYSEKAEIQDDIITTYNLTPDEILEYEKIKNINRALFFNDNKGSEEDKEELDDVLKKIFVKSLLNKRNKENNK